MPAEDDDRVYRVVVNDELQHSILLEDRDLPAGWRALGPRGGKRDCLDHIEQVWTDMRPLSLRERIGEAARRDAQSGHGAQTRGHSDG